MSIDFLFSDKNISCVNGAIEHLKSCGVWDFFDERAITFITKFASLLLKYPNIKQYPDLVALAYWFRRANINKMYSNYSSDIFRRGRGISLHIAPSNVDTIFVYSFFLSLLSGNTSFIRVSQKTSPQLDIILELFQKLYDAGDTETSGRFVICTYPHENTTTAIVSRHCELRIIWGGNHTIKTITAIPLNPTALELKFPNRSSFAAINSAAIAKIHDRELIKLCQSFYSDIQLFGQQACSSPLALFFVGSTEPCEQYFRFIDAFKLASDNHQLSSSEVMNRYVYSSSLAINGAINKSDISFKHNEITFLKGNINSHSSFRNDHPGNGTLIQFFLLKLTDIIKYIRPEDQTLSVYGFSENEISALLSSLINRGIDRVVPIGQALEFNNIWDGVDLLETMSRKIDISKLKRK